MNVLSPVSDRVTVYSAGILAIAASIVIIYWGAKTLTHQKEITPTIGEVANV